MKVELVPDKKAILESIKLGQPVEGCDVVYEPGLIKQLHRGNK